MSSGGCCSVCKVVGVVTALAAINWGLVGLGQMDLVARLLGDMTTPARVVYGVIGLAGIMGLGSALKLCPCQKSGGSCEVKK